jgi:osmotically-inducible protein OsmY
MGHQHCHAGCLWLRSMKVRGPNVKIITIDDRVTLRGPVDTAEEKRLIGE